MVVPASADHQPAGIVRRTRIGDPVPNRDESIQYVPGTISPP
jgi:hypothetical protein